MSSETTGTAPDGAAATPRRGRAWGLVVIGGTLATVAGVTSLVLVVQAALSNVGASLLPPLAVMGIGVVIGGILASMAFKALGVRAGWRSALLGALVGVVGVLLPWVVAILIGRLGG